MATVINTVNGKGASTGAPEPDSGPDAPLYAKRKQIYPKQVSGPFRNLKWIILFLTLGVYYITPWIRWDRPGSLPDQAVLVDFDHSRFCFFFIQLWAQEVYYITGLLILAALALFLVTAWFGRLWCGYACPQTVWTDLYIFVERFFEGDRNARMKRDRGPTTLDKIWRKGAKHLSWLLIAVATGGAWVFYFRDAPTLMGELVTLQAPTATYVFIGILTFTTYSLAGTMREQVCTYMCPWPRIQGAMLDEHSLQVTYRYDRGEPRGPHKKGDTWDGRGDCIDCNQCVVVCPMGIDIRDGAQLECINCGLCVDACNDIMDKVERPRGLIAYDTDAAVAARSCGQKAKYKPIRTRTLFYMVAVSLVSAVMIYGLMTRTPVDLTVLRDRNPTFVQLKDGSFRNAYTVKIANKGLEAATYRLSLDGPRLKEITVAGQSLAAGKAIEIPVEANKVRSVRLFVIAEGADLAAGSVPVRFTVTETRTGAHDTVRSVFLSGRANEKRD